MTEIVYNGKEVTKMEVNGDEWVWFRFHFKDGTHQDTMNFKGTL